MVNIKERINGLRNNKINLYEWLYITPSAFQVTAHLFEGFIVPGVLGIIFKYWQDITRFIWYKVADIVSFNIKGFESIFDLYTLSVLILVAAFGAKLRKKRENTTELKSEFLASSPLRKRFITLRTSLIIFSFLFIFSISNAIDYVDRPEISNGFIFLLLFYTLSIVYLYIGLEFYLGFPYQKIIDRIEDDRAIKKCSIIYVALWPGLVTVSSLPMIISLGFYTTFIPILAENLRVLIFEIWGVWFLILWLSHLQLNWPSSKSLVGDTRTLISIIFLVGLTIIPLAPFAFNVEFSSKDSKIIISSLMLIGGFLATISFVFMLKINWKIPRNILLLVCFFLVVDRILVFVTSLIPGAH